MWRAVSWAARQVGFREEAAQGMRARVFVVCVCTRVHVVFMDVRMCM